MPSWFSIFATHITVNNIIAFLRCSPNHQAIYVVQDIVQKIIQTALPIQRHDVRQSRQLPFPTTSSLAAEPRAIPMALDYHQGAMFAITSKRYDSLEGGDGRP